MPLLIFIAGNKCDIKECSFGYDLIVHCEFYVRKSNHPWFSEEAHPYLGLIKTNLVTWVLPSGPKGKPYMENTLLYFLGPKGNIEQEKVCMSQTSIKKKGFRH